MKSRSTPVIALTVGDYNGVGPEVILKSIQDSLIRKSCIPLLVGPESVFEYYRKRLHMRLSFSSTSASALQNDIMLVTQPEGAGSPMIRPGKLSKGAGKAAAMALKRAVSLATSGIVDAIVTAPVSKKALHLAGFQFPGQTEFLQHLSASQHSATMMLVSDSMRVALVTTHYPLQRVPSMLTRTMIRDSAVTVHESLKRDFGIKEPRLAVLALNPHAGEQGDLGMEEIKIINPAIRDARRRKITIEGPFPADAFFGRYKTGMYDAVMAMFHDQGLIPLKMASFGTAVNYSAGLSVVRTSPDHGTAFDIAGTGKADPTSFQRAIMLAISIVRARGSV